MVDVPELDVREKLAHIDQMLADHDRKRQEIKLAPWQVIGGLILGAMTAGAAFMAAGATLFAVLLKWTST